jgi:glycosidase
VGGLDRDPSRTPMLWNSEYNAGFSDGDKVWLPINEDFEHANVKTESSDSNSYLTLYKNLIRLRQSSTALKYGDFLIFDSKHESLLAFTRRSDDESVTVFINMSDQDLTLQPDKSPGNFVLSSSPRTLLTLNSSDKTIFRPNEAAIFKN